MKTKKDKKKKYKNCEVNQGKREQGAVASSANRKSNLAAAIVTAVIIALIFYFGLFAINIKSPGFWGVIIAGCIIFLAVKAITFWSLCFGRTDMSVKDQEYQNDKNKGFFRIPAIIIGAFIVIAILGAPIFHSGKYASVLKVQDSVFEEDLAETLSTDSIALMDTYSAQMLGDREIGSLSNVVSQYNVSDDYTQIDHNGAPLKVSALEYAGFFKWINNRSEGIPGYVTVNPVSMSADYQTSEKGMKYVPSAYLGQDLARHIRMHYPTAIFGNLHFEIDEEGNPYYIASVYDKTIGLFGGETVKGAIIADPTDGSMEYVDIAEVPQWVDVVFPGDLLCTQYDWYGKLQNGFINSIIGKKGCKQVTMYREDDSDEGSNDAIPLNDYGFVAKDGDIWIYTGITSVNGDSSNIGFLMANERTGETHYYEVAGADEKSAMAAAEGEVQEKGYQASFPSLINIDGEPTYIMVLKDASGLVKLYAAVNVEQYNLVTTASTQTECIQKYRNLIGTGEAPEEGDPDAASDRETEDEDQPLEATDTKDIVVADIKYIDIDGNTYAYIIDEQKGIYRQKVADNDALLFLKAGDRIRISYNGKELIAFETIEDKEQ